MCVIIYSVKPISGDEIADAVWCNPDGIAWSKWQGKRAGWSVPAKFAPEEGDGSAYRKEVDRLCSHGLPAGSVFWARIATGSRKNVQNCQPFPICSGRGWLWHNGIIGDSTAAESDTRALGAILATASPDRAAWLLESLAGLGAGKFLVQWHGDGAPDVFGRWEVEKGATWRSNNNHLVPVYDWKDWKEAENERLLREKQEAEEAAAFYDAERTGGGHIGEVIDGLAWVRG